MQFSNNLSDNIIRLFCVGRRNWVFSDTPEGANASALISSMVEMARAHNLNVEKYISFLLMKRQTTEMSDEELEALTPWSKDARDFFMT